MRNRVVRGLLLWAVIAALSPLLAELVRYFYDDAGRLIRVEYDGGRTIAYQYDAAGNLLRRSVSSQAASQVSRSKQPERQVGDAKPTRSAEGRNR